MIDYSPIGGSSYFQHFNLVDNTDYELYSAIKGAYSFLITNNLPVTDQGYADILLAMNEAMQYEVNTMNSAQIAEVIPLLFALQGKVGVDARYRNLYYLFNSLENLNSLYITSARIMALDDTKPVIEYTETTLDDLSETHTIYSGSGSTSFSVSTLELLNLQASDREVPTELLRYYIPALGDINNLEVAIKNNLFNYSTFSNSEIRAFTLLPDYELAEEEVFEFVQFVYASEYFHKLHPEYITLSNYVNFDELSNYCLTTMNGFKYLLDYLDSLDITPDKDPLSYYPSGQAELYAEMESLRQTAMTIAMVYNLAYIFKGQQGILKELYALLDRLVGLEEFLFTEANLISALMLQFGITEAQARDILFNGFGTIDQINFVNNFITSSSLAYSNSATSLGQLKPIAMNFNQLTSSYTSVSSYYKESKYDWTDINTSINGSMGTINGLVSTNSSKVNGIAPSLLGSYGLTNNLSPNFNLGALKTLAEYILSFSLISRLASCALMAISCATHFIASILSEITDKVGDLAGTDFSKFHIDNLINSASDTLAKLASGDMLSKVGTILSDVASHFTPAELAKISNALISSITGINLSCFSGGMGTMYNEALSWVKSSLTAGSSCKFKAPNLNKIKLDLRRKLDMKAPDMRFKLRTCTGR